MPERPALLRALGGAALALACGLFHASTVAACLRPAPLEFTLDPQEARVDRSPPSTPSQVTASASRSSGEYCDGDGRCTVSTCGSTGTLNVEFTPAQDDRVPSAELGYRLRWAEGSVPPALEQPLRRIAVGMSPLRFELPFEFVPELDATFELIAIDRAGNESAASEPFRAAFDGCTSSVGFEGCAEDRVGRVVCAGSSCMEVAEASGCALLPGRARAAHGWGWAALATGCALAIRARRRL